MIKWAGMALAAVVILLAAFFLYHQLTTPKVVLGYDTVTVKSANIAGLEATARTRKVRQGDIEFWEVELSRDAWVPCEADCAYTLRREKIDFWRTRMEEKK